VAVQITKKTDEVAKEEFEELAPEGESEEAAPGL
jgi:hypothetical protein